MSRGAKSTISLLLTLGFVASFLGQNLLPLIPVLAAAYVVWLVAHVLHE